jgi:hypothetical protein
VTGFTVSTTAVPEFAAYNKAQIPVMATTGASSIAQFNEYPYLFGSGQLFASEGSTEISFLKSTVPAGTKPRIALFTAESPAGDAFAAQVEASMKAAGWGQPVLAQSLPVAQPLTNLVPEAQSVMRAHADYVIGTIFTSYSTAMTSALQQAGFTSKVVTNYAGGEYIALKQINSPNYYTTQAFNYLRSGSPVDLAVIERNVDAIGGSAAITGYDTSVSMGWVTGALISAGLTKCGYPCSGVSMRKALTSIGNIGDPQNAAAGSVGFTAADRLAISSERVYHFVNGQTVSVGGLFGLPK